MAAGPAADRPRDDDRRRGGHAETAVVKSVGSRSAASGGSCSRATSRISYERGTVVVHGNVALATHGETVQQLLGSGRARDAVPALHARARRRSPTCSRRPTRRAPRPTLEVRVNDVRWSEVPTLYGAGRRDRAYAVRTDEARRDVRAVRRRRARRAPADRLEQRARDATARGSAPPATSRPARSRSCSTGRSASRASSNPVAGERRRRPRDGGVGARVDPARRAHARPRRLAARLRGLRARVHRRRKAQAAVLALRGGRTIVVTRRVRRAATGSTTSPRRCGRTATRASRWSSSPARRQTFRLALKVAVDPAYEARRGARRGRGGAARGVLVRRARLRASRCSAPRSSRSRTRSPASLAVDLDRLYVTGTPPGLADRLLAQQPAVEPGRRRDPGRRARPRPRRRSTGWRR